MMNKHCTEKEILLMKRLSFIVAGTASFFLYTVPVHADYIDPSIMTYAIQAIAGIVIALSTFFGVYAGKLRRSIHGKEGVKNGESDDLLFHDPKDGTVIKTSVPEQGNTDSPAQKKPRSDLIHALILAFSISFMFCFYEPLQIFFTNRIEFDYEFRNIIGWITLLSVMFFLFLVLFFFLSEKLSKKLFYILFFLMAWMFFAMYVQGTILISDLPPTNGAAVDWSLYGKQRLQSFFLYGAVFLACLCLLHFFRKKFWAYAAYGSLFITAVLSVTLAVTCVRTDGMKRSVISPRISTDDLNLVSSTQNFIVLVMDAMDSMTFQKLAETENPEYREYFEDFTYYPDTLAGYPYTRFSLPLILTGEWYENQETFTEFSTRVLKNSRLFSELENKGYSMSLYENEVICEDRSFLRFTNISDTRFEIDSPHRFMKDELWMSFYMFMPYQLKPYAPDVFERLSHEDSTENLFSWDNIRIHDYFKENDLETTPDRRFIYIHAKGAHLPYEYDRDLNRIPEEENPTYIGNVQGTVTLVHEYLRLLKKAGTYDNSAVIIMGDHGYAEDDRSVGRQNPLLMVKGINEHHPFQTSENAVSFSDLMDAYQKLMDGASSEVLFPYTKDRTRRYLYHVREDEITEFELKDASAWETESLKETGRQFNQ